MDVAAGIVGTCAVGFLALALFTAWRFRPARPTAPGHELPPLTVLKPLHGDEPRLYEALRSFCTQAYPGNLQIVFGVADPDDPAALVAERLVREFPDRDLVLVRGTGGQGTNRKVANLLGIAPFARHDLLALSDSDVVLAGPDHLAAVVAELQAAPADPPLGAITCLYRALPTASAASRFAALHIDHHFLSSALVAQRFGPPATCYGKLTMLRRPALDTAGGLRALADQVADDAELGWMLRRAGFGTRVSPLIVGTVVSETPGTLWQHELRWARTVRSTEPVGHAMTLITHALPLLAAATLLHPDALTAALPVSVLLLRTALHRIMARRIGTAPAPIWQVVGRETLCFAVWLASYGRRTVTWQGVALTLQAGGRIAPNTARAAPAPKPAIAGVRRRSWIAGICGLALAALLAAQAGPSSVGDAVAAAGWGALAAAAALHVTAQLICAVAWWLVCPGPPGPRRPTCARLVGVRLVRDAMGEVLPMVPAGELVAVRELMRTGLGAVEATALTVADVTVELGSQAVFYGLTLGMIVATGLDAWNLLGLSGLAGNLFIFGGCVWVQHSGGSHLARLCGGAVPLLRDMPQVWDRLHGALRRIYRRHGMVAVAAAIHLIAWSTGSLQAWVVLHLMGVSVPLAGALALEAFMASVRRVAPTPGAVGVQEGGYVLAGAVLGIDGGTALALSLVKRARDLLVAAPVLLAWQAVAARRARRSADGEAATSPLAGGERTCAHPVQPSRHVGMRP